MKLTTRIRFTYLKVILTSLSSIITVSIFCQTCMSPTTYYDLLEININQISNTFDIANLSCDPCVFGSGTQQFDDCLVSNNCQLSCSNSQEICHDLCIENNTGIGDLVECINDCNNTYDNCIYNCPNINAEVRTPTNYIYGIRFWWSTNCQTSMGLEPDQEFISGWISGSPPDPLSISLVDDLTMLTISYCYQTEVQVIYNDGTCCRFLNSECFDIC